MGFTSWGYRRLYEKLNLYAMQGRYDFQQLVNYRYEMYSRSYLDWNCNSRRDSYIQETSYMNEGLNRMKVMKTLCIVQVCITIVEMVAFVMASTRGSDGDGCHDNPVCCYGFFVALRTTAFCLCVWMFALLYGNMTADNKPENLPSITNVQ
jgi:hypothetical protein